MKWLKRLTGKRNGAQSGALSADVDAAVLNRAAFERELKRQRALCDRRGGGFILMVISIASTGALKPGHRTLEKLAAVVSKRVRLSDVAGVSGENSDRIGVILAEADHAGAEEFLRSIEGLMRGSLNGSWTPDFRLRCELFPYPERIAAVMVSSPETVRDAAPVETR